MAFPCNQFAKQEPKGEAEIKKFAAKKGFQGVLMSKVNVNANFRLLPCCSCPCIGGAKPHPLWDYLQGDEPITWNFEKFLVSRAGAVLKRYGPKDGVDKSTKKPTDDLLREIDAALGVTAN